MFSPAVSNNCWIHVTDQPMPPFTVPPEALESRIKQSNFYRFVTAYRQHGHRKANINPIAITEERFVCMYKYCIMIEDTQFSHRKNN
jgi:2-oxoglutarate dehydrogenase complex dehydrogenase (E1) component-like enzyme